jgi:hypothetical protein
MIVPEQGQWISCFGGEYQGHALVLGINFDRNECEVWFLLESRDGKETYEQQATVHFHEITRVITDKRVIESLQKTLYSMPSRLSARPSKGGRVCPA